MMTAKCLYCNNVSPLYYCTGLMVACNWSREQFAELTVRVLSCGKPAPASAFVLLPETKEQYTYLPINCGVLIDEAYLTALSVIQTLVRNAWIIANFAVST